MILFQNSKKAEEDTAYNLLLDEVEKTKSDLLSAYSNFENVIEPDLIDSCIYHVNAIQMRYQFLLTRVKQFESFARPAVMHTKPEDFHAKNPLELSES